jgi:cellulose synthase/poly-beta-1,6-N-acetylglucosamine synthase-like glycosyltransferase
MILFIVLSILFLIQTAIIVLLMLAYKRKPSNGKSKIKEVSILIPFHNEAQRIGGIISSINDLLIPDDLEVEILFIEDNSTDISREIINKELKKQFKILESSGQGKKDAIRMAVQDANFKNILCWDADISFGKDYLFRLKKEDESDLMILPVRLSGEKMFQKLNGFEFSWMQLLTFGMVGRKAPFLCNGANLLFKKESFLAAEKVRSDQQISSGDDVFLLEAIKSNGGDISWCTDDLLVVKTAAPISWKSLRSQRKRWAGKMTSLMSSKTILGLIVLFTMILGLGLSIFALSVSWLFVIVILLKIINEWMIIQFIDKSGKPDHDFLLVIVHQFWYPIYLLSLLFPVDRNGKWDRNR